MKLIISLLLALASLQAQNFTKEILLGEWELSSSKLNQSVSFGKYVGRERNEVLRLLFNSQGMMKVVNAGDVYNYEIVQGQLKIYETKVYRNNYQIKQTNRYDLMRIVGESEGCAQVKIVEKKIPGYKSSHDLKMCKIAEAPQPTYQSDISKYKF